MKRIDKVYNCLLQKSLTLKKEDLEIKKGFSTDELSNELDIIRNNVSLELNNLVRQGKVVKLIGRPVLYLPKEILERLLNISISKSLMTINSHSELIEHKINMKKKEDKSPFDFIIGSKGSLKTQIEQAKAAVLYPPNGLHTLILGPTGVGKTLFANKMYSYAKFAGKLKEDSPFIVFNCADYYNNPQLLISQIFGHVKGSFTGAETEREGLVEKADGGILFLDEVHRLPPEGQEMMFYFMDTSTFNKLGESERNRKANVLILCATTEDPNSSLLKTFIRRIPIIINIPNLDERPIREKVDIIKHLLRREANRVNKSIKITSDVIKALIGSISFGNIGQLKSNIQLICATGFLNSIKDKNYINIEFKGVPSQIKSGYLVIGNKRNELEEILEYIDESITIVPEGSEEQIEQDNYDPPFNLYKIIEDKASILRDEGVDDEYIQKFITTDINLHLKSFYDNVKADSNTREKFSKIVDEDIIKLSEEIRDMVEKTLNRRYNERFIYAMSLHISSFLKRVQEGIDLKYEVNMNVVIKDNPKEYEVAIKIGNIIRKNYNIVAPDIELIYLTLLLTSMQDTTGVGKVGIVVAAHGSSTASSMVAVAVKLLGEYNITAVDMPLEVGPRETFQKILEAVKCIDMGKGVLLLVDMGSLYYFEKEIIENTGIEIKTLDMVSTALVLEALRKANLFDMDLDSIYESLKRFKGYGKYEEVKNIEVNKAIVTICSTGQGAAIKLKELIQSIVKNITEEPIEIIPVSIKNLKEQLKNIQDKYEVLATVGVKNPKIDSPFISLEKLISGEGERELEGIIKYKNIKIIKKDNEVITKELCLDSLNEFLTYINPKKVIGILMTFSRCLQKEFNTQFSNSMTIRLVIHTGCALERMIINDGLHYGGNKGEINKQNVNKIKKVSKIFKDSINVELSEDEIYYIADMF
ncbi:sigma-54 factor, interaction domain-containing protein [Clostridium putrefaciens]|uniref:Sigma-54 factor, interaction domain-containing protein n=1 Tax=Clostridium putrefaciens TaxID=99675 RepID=A0A381J505_9CLOT|nr:sigma-54-dependent transcriptional regulator [Clostridium putrefaciens]SUY45624.1 sigma-54 factor, interaction domain-containing protein [Clostridium putrefaciens]